MTILLDRPIFAIVLAAGLSSRMGHPKINLSWGESTVLGTVIETLLKAGVNRVIAVTGPTDALGRERFEEQPVNFVHNPRFQEDSMLLSLQTGMKFILSEGDAVRSKFPEEPAAALVALGDMPLIQDTVVRELIACFRSYQPDLIVPSFRMQRGHPWLVSRLFWSELLALPSSAVMRDFLDKNADKIHYLPVDNDSILRDIDTPQDYVLNRPEI